MVGSQKKFHSFFVACFVFLSPMQLIGNAVKFTEKGSVSVFVSTIATATTATMNAPDHKNRPVYRIEVVDTGRGIPEKILPDLFDPFTKAHNYHQSEGSGLGLSIAKKFTEAMGGVIGVETTIGVGSTFWIEIPFDSLPPDSCGPSLSRPIVQQGTSPTIAVLATSQTLKIVLSYLSYWNLPFEVIQDRQQLQDYSCAIVEEREVIVRPEFQPGLVVIPDFYALMRLGSKMVLLTSFSLHHRMKEHIEQQRCEELVCAISSPLTPNKMARAVTHLQRGETNVMRRVDVRASPRMSPALSPLSTPPLSMFSSFPSLSSFLLPPSASTFPQSQSPLLLPLTPTRGFNPIAPGLLDVLLVEDNPVNQTVMKKQFELLKVNFAITGNAEDALAIWERCVGGISLILMDVELDGPMTGLQATAKIREREKEEEWRRGQPGSRKSPLIAIMTGRALEEDRREAFACGCDEFLVKPVTLDRVRDLVSRLVLQE